MAVIDRDALTTDVLFYLTYSPNKLSESEIRTRIVDVVVPNQLDDKTDDDEHYSEALCKSLKLTAETNKLMTIGTTKGVRKHRTEEVETEFFERTSGDPWGTFLDTLPEVCPILPGGGYNLRTTTGMIINSGKKPNVNPCKAKTTDDYSFFTSDK